ncbi:MAG: hypothetical protein JXB00_01795 [Bacteroidales bacterium]|nr:hypothetical protein [Bacteroidales bacterium]
MRNYVNAFLFSFMLVAAGGVKAQIAINSPYTRFGLGEISLMGSGLNRSLGGTSIGHRFGNQINFNNPASYSSQDTMSFILDFGLNGETRRLSSAFEKVKLNDFNMGHLAIAFPVTKWWAASMGVHPYSRIGYNMMIEGNFSTTQDIYQIYFKGNGNLNRFFVGTGLRFGKHIAVGANMSYIFGTYERNRTVIVPPIGNAQTLYVNRSVIGDVLFNFGAQAFTSVGENHQIVLGATLDNETDLKGEYSSYIINSYTVNIDTMKMEEDQEGAVTIPLRFGIGGSYAYKNKLFIAFDYIKQDWTNARFFGNPDSLARYTSMRFGIQYTPVSLYEVKRVPYWQRINIRAGGYYNQSYLQINGEHLKDYGITFGVGIPWRNEKNLLTKTSFNISYQLGWQGSLDNGLVKESYQVFSIGFTLYDFWFIKRKYD